MSAVCITDGCGRATRPDRKGCRFCSVHESRLARGAVRETELLPKCPGCGSAMREPAALCGFCATEARETAAKEQAA